MFNESEFDSFHKTVGKKSIQMAYYICHDTEGHLQWTLLSRDHWIGVVNDREWNDNSLYSTSHNNAKEYIQKE